MEQYDHGERMELPVLRERFNNFMRESEADRCALREDVTELRKQTHEWMQAMLNRLPPWAVAVGSAMWLSLGAMAMWIINHR